MKFKPVLIVATVDFFLSYLTGIAILPSSYRRNTFENFLYTVSIMNATHQK